MPYPTASQTEVFVLATQLHDEMVQFLSKSTSAYVHGFEDAFRKVKKNPKPFSATLDEDEEDYIKGFTFGTALRAIVRRKHLGLNETEED